MSYKTTGLKRKRSSSAALLMVARPYKKKTTTRRAFIPGVDRTGGYYGRYSGRGAELKFHDVDLDDAVVANVGTQTSTVNIIAQGVTESTRVGRKCTIKGINWNMYMTLPRQDAQALPVTGDTLRVILYIDKQCNGGTPTVLQLLESDDWQSFRNLANSSRFNFLYDKNITLNYQAAASDGAGLYSSNQMVKIWQFHKSCNIPLEFNNVANDGSLATIRSNNLGVLLISSQGICGFESKFRLRFSDAG